MTIHVRHFAVLRDRRGLAEEMLADVAPQTVRHLIDYLIRVHQLDLPSSLIRPAVNGTFVIDDYALQDGDVVGLLPPVAGG